MEIRLAKFSGFCFGVKRAIDIAMKSAAKFDSPVTLGPIIHNPQMVAKLKKKGIDFVNDLNEINNRATIIRSHGVKKEVYTWLKKHDIKIIDATCPYVSKAQESAKKFIADGYFVYILGDKNHPEVIGLKSYTENKAKIVKDKSEIIKKKMNKIGIVCQTTQNLENLKKIVNAIIPWADEIRIKNTICNATSKRQNSTANLAARSDFMIVIGGKNSANTKMLKKISQEYTDTIHIETKAELSKEMLENKNKIGLTAGASTPNWIIIDVYKKILEMSGNKVNKSLNVEDIPIF